MMSNKLKNQFKLSSKTKPKLKNRDRKRKRLSKNKWKKGKSNSKMQVNRNNRKMFRSKRKINECVHHFDIVFK